MEASGAIDRDHGNDPTMERDIYSYILLCSFCALCCSDDSGSGGNKALQSILREHICPEHFSRADRQDMA